MFSKHFQTRFDKSMKKFEENKIKISVDVTVF